MKETTRYQYEKRIKALTQEKNELSDKLYIYKTCVHEIYDGIVTIKDGNSISISWILGRIKRCLR